MDIAMVDNNDRKPAAEKQPVDGATLGLLTPNEPPAPTSALSRAKCAALIACLTGGTLCNQRGFWVSPHEINVGSRIAGITVAGLARDGMLNIVWIGKRAVARLTVRGSWYARTIASTVAAGPELPH
jgi:hypothetical protein